MVQFSAELMASTPMTDKLLQSDPFDFSESNRKLFVDSFREVAAIHYDGHPTFQAFWKEAGIHPDDIQTEADLNRVPPLMVHLFKEHELVTGPRNKIALTLTSSGTGGQKSQIFLDQGSLDRVKKLAYRIHESLGMTTTEKVNYLCFTYDPSIAKDLGTAFTDELLTSFTGKKSVYYTFQWNDQKKEFFFNEPGTIETLRRFEAEKLPMRILGFPAFLHQVLNQFPDSFHFGPHSWVQTGGGWKGQADKEIPKQEFRKSVSSRLGLPVENMRDLFGMVEHGIPYVDCERGQMHIPNFARVLTRSPDGRKILKNGERGLLQLMCTYNTSYPAMNLLTTDWGRVGYCECKTPGPTLELLGRAGVSQSKGCAIKASEMLRQP